MHRHALRPVKICDMKIIHVFKPPPPPYNMAIVILHTDLEQIIILLHEIVPIFSMNMLLLFNLQIKPKSWPTIKMRYSFLRICAAMKSIFRTFAIRNKTGFNSGVRIQCTDMCWNMQQYIHQTISVAVSRNLHGTENGSAGYIKGFLPQIPELRK